MSAEVKGYAGKMLRVDLSEGKTWDWTPEEETLRMYLGGTGIDMEQWSTCAEDTESEAYKAAAAAVDADTALGKQLGVQGTPGFFVNGQFLKGAQPPAQFEPLIQKARGTAPPPPAKTDALP